MTSALGWIAGSLFAIAVAILLGATFIATVLNDIANRRR